MLTDRSRIARSLCSALAIATATLLSAETHAQTAPSGSFQGNGTFNSGSGSVVQGPGTTTINVTSPNAVIDWSTFDTTTGGGPIIFQPSSTTATFQSFSNFSVLNRILPTDPSRAVQFNGNVVAQIQGTTTTPGGTVYFYSPGGIIVGSTAVFNVGNLGLTSAAPQVVAGVFEQINPVTGSKFVNLTAANPATAVQVQAGAQINALNNNYVALVAPVIDQRGTINVNGAAALVSADAATITFNPNGLFDIQVTSGTSGTGTTLFNSGSITGPAFVSGVNHRIYAVAVPKNTAITLAIAAGSTLGFNIAGAADVVGNSVVLSAGRDIVGGAIASARSPGGGTGAADLNIANTAVTSALVGSSTNNSFFFSIGGGTASAASTVNLQADTRATFTADGAGSVTTANGLVNLRTTRTGNGVTGGQTDIFAINNGSLTITAGGASLFSQGLGVSGGNAIGGSALITASTGGDVSITGPVNLFADGVAGADNAGIGGNGTGGRAQIAASDTGSSITINGLVNVDANGVGGLGNGGVAGGIGTGGQALVNAQVAASDGIAISGATVIRAGGQGGNANGGPAGAGFGGNAIAAASFNNSVQFGSTLSVRATGSGGNATGGNAGSGTGGTARITLFSSGTMSIGGAVQLFGLGVVGTGNPNSALGTGGLAAVSVQQNSILNAAALLEASSSGLGDRAFAGFPTNGAGIGGTTTVDAFTNGAINVGGVLRVRADATAANGGNSTAGTATVAANSGGDITASQLNVSTDGVGGADTGTGAGFGRGGTASIFANGAGSTITVANGNSTGAPALGELDFLSAEGFGGVSNGGGSGVGGAATGGTVNLSATAGGLISGPANTGTQGFVRIIARATGGNANTGATAGGQATGGNINITIDNATFTSADLLPSSFALGGSAAPTATGTINGGNALGGQRNITVRNGATATTSFSGGGPGAQGGDATASGRGGDASGGNASLVVDNATLTLTKRSVVFSQNISGSGGTAGNVIAGTAYGQVSNGGILNVPDDATSVYDFSVTSNAFGPAAGAVAGNAQGNVTAGNATLLLQGGTINGPGSISVQAGAAAMTDQYSQGGTYRGGQASLLLQGGTISSPTIYVSANADAGAVGAGLIGTGGSATGGTALVQASANTTNLTGSQILVEALGLGGNLLGTGTAGNGTGGRANIGTNTGTTLNVSGNVILSADGTGGSDTGTGNSGVGGFGTGGLTELGTFMGGSLNLSGNLSAFARGLGGATSRSGFAGGAGTGGIAQIYHDTTGSITLASAVDLVATGLGGAGLTAGAAGGAGSGGQARAILYNVGTGSLAIAGDLLADATGTGGSGNSANGGNAIGGFARIGGDAAGKTITINGAATLRGEAAGGLASGSGLGGNAVGGSAQVNANNSSISISGSPFVSSAAVGGSSQNGRGGSATGGSSLINASNSGSIAVPSTSAVTTIDASGRGGSASGTGNGGDAGAGRAHLFVNGGSITIGGNVSLFGDAHGGDGVNGGDAISARPFRQPRALIGSFNGTISVAGTSTLVSVASGGNARLGGTGGIAFAGGAAVEAQSNNGPSAINLAALNLDASAFGGDGGNGGESQVGGAGGEAYGGGVSAFGQAGQGRLTVTGQTIANASADGGLGGTGGSGATGAAGGNGGRAIGGSVSFGTVSGPDTPSNTGSASFSLVTGDASGDGGDGGAGGTGTTAGAGGTGGTGFGGSAGILVRGSPATFTDVALTANGIGGDGGAGAVQGNGGDGYAGDGFTIVTQRFMRTERGTLTANNVAISASGVAGTGATAGRSFYSAAQGAEGEFFIRQSDVSIGNYSLTTSGNLSPNVTATILSVFDPVTGITVPSGIPVLTSITITAEPYDLSLLDSTVTIANGFTLTTPGQMRVTLDNSTLNTAGLTLSAGNFVLPAAAPTVAGTLTARSGATFTSTADFLTYANLVVPGGTGIIVPGAIRTGNIDTSTLALQAGSGIIATGNIVGTGNVAINAAQSLTTGSITSPQRIGLTSGGTLTTGALQAGDSVTAQAVGALSVGDVSAGIVNPSTTAGAQYTIALRSLGSITAGNLNARLSVGLSSPGTISAGTISAGLHVLGLAGTGFSSGAITTPLTSPLGTPRVYIANFSMEALGGQIGASFNPAPIFAATSVAQIGGPITISGPIISGATTAAATGAINVGAITNSVSTFLNGRAGISAGAITAGQVISLFGGTGAITAGALQAGDSINVSNAGSVTLGNLSAGLVQPSTSPSALYRVVVENTGGSVTTGSIAARRDVGIQAPLAITTGNISGRDVLLLPGTSLTTGSIQALNGTQPSGRVYIGNYSMASSANGFVSSIFTNLPLFNLEPVRTGGPITINGGVTAGSLFASTAQGISLQDVTAGTSTSLGFIDLDSGGTVTVNGRLAAGRKIDIASRDIDITATGSLDALSSSGEIQLASNNPNGAFIGDGLTTTSGYMLSNAEYARLKAGKIAVIGDDQTGLVTDMTIGTLSIAASQLYGTSGTALFATGNRDTQTPSGLLRIAGAVTASGFTPTNEVDLASGTVELEAEKGSLKVDNGSGGLGGQIVIQANNIHVASDAILTKLRADPLYAGHVQELNAPALVQRTDGVLNAFNLDFSSKSQTVYIQNTGSIAVPAGIVTRLDSNTSSSNNTGSEGTRPPGGSEFVINGQIQTDTGIVTGKAAFDLLIANEKAKALANGETFASDLTLTSTFNGCVITTGICAFGNTDPVAALSSEISVVTNATLDESPVAPAADDSDEGDEAGDEKKDEDDSSDEGSSPIAPPTPLISTRALDGNVNVVEPVSGAGNPALFGSAVDETTVQGEKP